MKSSSRQKSGYLFASILLVSLLFISQNTYAAAINPETSATLYIQPKNPGANSHVDATIESYLLDLQRAKITWYVNGALKQTGTGNTEFSFTTGALGKPTALKVIVDATDGTHVEKTLSIRPGNVDLAWEGISSVPPFYKGKALFSKEGAVKLIALPDLLDASGATIPADRLIYKWTKDRTVVGENSGYGKNSYAFAGDMLVRPVQIKVEVSATSGDQSAEKTITIAPTDPSVVLYEDDPLFGIKYERAIGANFTLSNPEIAIASKPFFFTNDSNLNFSWSLNGNPFTEGTSDNGRSVILRNEGQVGTASISLLVKRIGTLFQQAQTQSSIILPDTAQINDSSTL